MYGFPEDTSTEDIIRTVHSDNPTTAFNANLLHLWRGPRYKVGSPTGLNFVSEDHPPAFTLGAQLLALGAKSIVKMLMTTQV